MINFVTKDDKNSANLAKIRRLVVGWTTVILGVYIVGAGGVAGWTILWNGKQKQASRGVSELTRQVTNYSDNQVLISKLMERSGAVNRFLDSRGDASDAARIMLREGFSVFSWQYTPNSIQRMTILGPGANELREYANYLKTYYDKVQVEKIFWSAETGWSGTFLVSMKKKV